MRYERDSEGNVVGVEMSIQECTRSGWLFCDRNKLPAHKPLRDEILRHQQAYRDELAAKVAEQDAEFRNTSRSGTGGGVEGIAEFRERMARIERDAEDRRRKNRARR